MSLLLNLKCMNDITKEDNLPYFCNMHIFTATVYTITDILGVVHIIIRHKVPVINK